MATKDFALMSEPISSAAGGFAISKAIPILGPILAACIVMCMATPKSKKELFAAMLSTVSLSVFGGAFIVSYFKLNAWAHDSIGIMALTGICFVCGLPGWLIVRAAFHWMEKQKDKDLAELAKAVAKEVHDIKNPQ